MSPRDIQNKFSGKAMTYIYVEKYMNIYRQLFRLENIIRICFHKLPMIVITKDLVVEML